MPKIVIVSKTSFSHYMKRIAFTLTLLLTIMLRENGWAQVPVPPLEPDLTFTADFSATSNSAPDIVQDAEAVFIPTYTVSSPPDFIPESSSNMLGFTIALGSVPAAHVWVFQLGNDGLLTTITEITNKFVWPFPIRPVQPKQPIQPIPPTPPLQINPVNPFQSNPVIIVDQWPLSLTNIVPITPVQLSARAGTTTPAASSVFPPNVPYYVYSQNLQLTPVQFLNLGAGRWYVGVDFGTTNFISPLRLLPDENPVPFVRVRPSGAFFYNADNAVSVVANNRLARVAMDGYISFNYFSFPLQFTWTENGRVLGTMASLTNLFTLGDHQVMLTVDDALGSNATAIQLKVITPGDDLRLLVSEVTQLKLENWQKSLILGNLIQAAFCFDHGNQILGRQWLRRMQEPVYLRPIRLNPEEAAYIITTTQEIIDTMEGQQF